jgi:hypothetical protein
MVDVHAVQSHVEEKLLQVALAIEDQIDLQTKKLEDLDEDDLERIREKRMAEMRKMNEQRANWRRIGHGQYQLLTNEKEFFEAAKASDHMICHFFRSSTQRCKIMDKHLELLAPKHIETRFVRIDAEKSPYLVQNLRVVVLPTIALVRKGKTVDYIVGFDDLGGQDDFPTEVLEWRIACQGIIQVDYSVHDGPPTEGTRAKYGGKMVKARAGIWQSHSADSDDDDLDD